MKIYFFRKLGPHITLKASCTDTGCSKSIHFLMAQKRAHLQTVPEVVLKKF